MNKFSKLSVWPVQPETVQELGAKQGRQNCWEHVCPIKVYIKDLCSLLATKI